MRNITQEELNEILRKHELWLKGKGGGERANLSGADLIGADLSEALLCRANLREATLRGANLSKANLCEADLGGAHLYIANLNEADLSGANLRGAKVCSAYLYRSNLTNANLCEANLGGAHLYIANLSNADLDGANLRSANLCYANVSNANLYRANLGGANLTYTNIYGVKAYSNTSFFHLQCPEEGSFIGWKKAVHNYEYVIVKLLITEDALRSSATTRKCRASKAEVLDIQDLDGNSLDVCSAHSNYDEDFIYKVGEVVEVGNFDPCRWKECSAGIHFFVTRQEAVDYSL